MLRLEYKLREEKATAKKLNIRPLRKRKSLKQKELACRIGVTNSYLCQIEKGIRTPSLDVLLRLSDELGCKIDDMFEEDQIA